MDLDLDPSVDNLSVQGARELAQRSLMPRSVCNDYFYRYSKRTIRLAAGLGRTEVRVLIPAFTAGLPLYDVNKVASDVEQRLRSEGWRVRRSLHILYVSWAAPRTAPPKTAPATVVGRRK